MGSLSGGTAPFCRPWSGLDIVNVKYYIKREKFVIISKWQRDTQTHT